MGSATDCLKRFPMIRDMLSGLSRSEGHRKPTSGDVAVEFVPYDPKAIEDMEHLKKVVTLIKERQVPVANVGYLKPAQVVAQVEGPPSFSLRHGSARARVAALWSATWWREGRAREDQTQVLRLRQAPRGLCLHSGLG
jgi:hypothetical protein